MSIVIRNRHFTAGKKLFSADADGLSAVLRGMAVDNARIRIKLANPLVFTDSTTGTSTGAPYKVVDVPLPLTAFNATTAGGAQLAAFLTSIGLVNNAHAVLATGINLVLTPLGLPAISGLATGTVVTPGTVPAMTKTATTANGTAAMDFSAGRATMAVAKQNHQKIIRGLSVALAALGAVPLGVAAAGAYGADAVLLAPPTATAAATGASAVLLADATAFFLALANNAATMSAAWDAVLTSVAAGTSPLSIVAG
jgi:hypothetical protein